MYPVLILGYNTNDSDEVPQVVYVGPQSEAMHQAIVASDCIRLVKPVTAGWQNLHAESSRAILGDAAPKKKKAKS